MKICKVVDVSGINGSISIAFQVFPKRAKVKLFPGIVLFESMAYDPGFMSSPAMLSINSY